MSDAAPLPPADAMQGVLSTAAPIPGVPLTIPVVSPPELAPPANSLTPNMESESVEPEYACETLYIQNLNEKIKINGMHLCMSWGNTITDLAFSPIYSTCFPFHLHMTALWDI
jgi:hypothetical protein